MIDLRLTDLALRDSDQDVSVDLGKVVRLIDAYLAVLEALDRVIDRLLDWVAARETTNREPTGQRTGSGPGRTCCAGDTTEGSCRST